MTTASQTMTEAIVEAILKCDRHASQGAMVSVSEVREAFQGFGFNVARFDPRRLPSTSMTTPKA